MRSHTNYFYVLSLRKMIISQCMDLVVHVLRCTVARVPAGFCSVNCVGVGLGRVPRLVGGWPGLTDWPQPLTSPEIVSRSLAGFSCISISEFSSHATQKVRDVTDDIAGIHTIFFIIFFSWISCLLDKSINSNTLMLSGISKIYQLHVFSTGILYCSIDIYIYGLHYAAY